MDDEKKVFSSDIIRTQSNLKNNLCDIFNVVPIQPVSQSNNKNSTCAFVPKCDKYYVRKNKIGPKVKTVREIRTNFERDIYSYLPDELQKQKNNLLRKIRYESSKDEKTKALAKTILKGDSPMLRSVWQMLMNVNPADHKFSSQFILWNGKRIQINGSRGGRRQYICNCDIGKINKSSYNKSLTKNNISNRKKRLLQYSLNVKFKPGPLSKKSNLDISYHKYNFGELKVVDLPQPGLEVNTSYGKPLAPLIDTFLQKTFLHNVNGDISQKWANYAVSVVGKIDNGSAVQTDADCRVTFDLNYKCFQNKLLMRHDSDFESTDINKANSNKGVPPEEESNIKVVVDSIMDKILDSVEISIKQDTIYNGEDDPREKVIENNNTCNNLTNKSKRKFCELGRLDVTVIKISDTNDSTNIIMCQNDYCNLGCVCDSLKCSYQLKRHCGRVECMLKCNCNFSKYKLMEPFSNECSDIIPGLINLDEKLGQTMAKEEHKFHQTVIVTNEKSILLKPERRNWKTSKKYADFYSNMCLRADKNTQQVLSIVCLNIDCSNIEPWCMVHNLYRCFCKGKFTETSNDTFDELKKLQNENDNPKLEIVKNASTTQNVSDQPIQIIDHIDLTDQTQVSQIKKCSQYLPPQGLLVNNTKHSRNNDSSEKLYNNDICARISPYMGRKYNDVHYSYTNKKIYEMEKNDKTLLKRIESLTQNYTDCNLDESESQIVDQSEPPTTSTSTSTLKEFLRGVIKQNENELEHTSQENEINNACPRPKRLQNKTNLVAWLESSYKQYKGLISQGLQITSLDPPIAGKLSLYPWDFILSRYRERKNHFLISEQKPYRIFVAVDINSFFINCRNISHISLSEINEYPVTIKNLLTNATDIKENFCVLFGLPQCWELIGSVTKVPEKQNGLGENEIDQLFRPECSKLIKDNSENNYSLDSLSTSEENDDSQDSIPCYETATSNGNIIPSDIPVSKWFVMIVENDFREIQFFEKGFFVKYESVIKAINVARISGKTVRLSSQKCADKQKDPHFGVYALPNNKCYCVFIGPYGKDESLGIETVKLTPHKTSNRTRGMWITTKEVDNFKVIDNPSFFMPSLLSSNSKAELIELHLIPNNNVVEQKKCPETVVKQVKPIKIKKTNGFYHLAPNGILKQIKRPKKNSDRSSLTGSDNAIIPLKTYPSFRQIINSKVGCKPVAEIAPHVKQCENDTNSPTPERRKTEGGMFILNPAEINKRSVESQLQAEKCLQPPQPNEPETKTGDIDMDIENFLATTVISNISDSDVYVISDDDDDDEISTKNAPNYKNVWIVCKNIESVGWIAGKRNIENKLSFEFPGFKYSEFYPEEEALSKINQVFARKIFVPKQIELEWLVTESEADVESVKKLESNDLRADNVLTKKGIRNKVDLKEKFKMLNNVLFKV